MVRLALLLILISVASCIAFSAIVPFAQFGLNGFYPVPWTLIFIGLIILDLSLIKPKAVNYHFAMAGFAACLGWLAWRLAVVIDHTCPSGWCGFLSVAFMMSIRFLTTAKEYWGLESERPIQVGRDLLLLVGISFFVTSFLIYPYTPHH